MRNLLRIAISAAMLCMTVATWAAEPSPPVKPFSLKYDFEDGRFPEIKPLVSNGKFTVNSMEITKEKAFGGGKSFKFEVTVESGSYHTWLISFNVALEGRLRMSYRYQVASTGKGTFGPGVSLNYPGIASGDQVDFFDWKNSTGGGWTWLDKDLTAFAKDRITGDGGGAWEIWPEQVAAYVNGMVICFRGTVPGERITLYIDDLLVEGATQELNEEFNRRAVKQWLSVKEKQSAAIQKMRDTISHDTRFLAAFKNLSPVAALFQQVALTDQTAWSAIVQAATQRGYLQIREVAAVVLHEERINSMMCSIFMLDGYDFTK